MVRASSPPKCLDRRDCVGRLCTGTRHGNVYRSVREKQGNVVYWQHVLQTVTSLRVVSLVFRGQDLLKIADINPQQEARLSLWNTKKTPKKALRLTCVRSYTGREIKNATISEFST